MVTRAMARAFLLSIVLPHCEDEEEATHNIDLTRRRVDWAFTCASKVKDSKGRIAREVCDVLIEASTVLIRAPP